MTQHHPVFANFKPYSGMVETGFQVDFIGARTRCEFTASASGGPAKIVQTKYPPVDEEYFEWIDILESVLAAKQAYSMIELGAGYGRWAVRAALALRQCRNLPFHLTAVEPEPAHFRWLGMHFQDNGIDATKHTLIRAAVAETPDEVMFYVGMPDGGKDRPHEWYGQAITKSYESIEEKAPETYEGRDLFIHKSGWKSISVESVQLPELIGDMNRIDLIDLDVQGEELKILDSTISEIDRKVVRLHIGTHSHEIEEGLRKLLSPRGWHCLADYKCCSENQTPWGAVQFVDGVQSWINPEFASS